MQRFLVFFSLIAGLLTACGGSPSEEVAVQEVLLETNFSESSDWPESLDVAAGTAVQFTNNGYQLSSESAAYVWAFGQASYADVTLETTVRQFSTEPNNAFGLVCRAGSNNQNGYYFLISGDGFVSIRRLERSLSSPIVDWTPSSAVRQAGRGNRLRAVCAGDYLALYVNGQLVAEGRDERFAEGRVGFAASGSEDGPVRVGYTDLTVRAAQVSR